jgi:predicted metal-dependent HD superfamily phosphohydrolase
MKKGLILFNAALIAESNMAYLCNNNTVLVTADKKSQERRLKERSLTETQIKKRLESQFNTHQKKEHLLSQIQNESCGQIWIIDNSDNSTEEQFDDLFSQIIDSVDIYGELRYHILWEKLKTHTSYQHNYHILINHYAEPERSYHTLSHIISGLEDLEEIRHLLHEPDEVECAWWYHDIIYKPGSSTNEEQSAAITREMLADASIDKSTINRICELILRTKHTAQPMDEDARYLVDIDLGILGAVHTDFLKYEEKIRNEFYFIQDQVYNEKRRQFLTQFLQKPYIYQTEYFRKKYEEQARENIQQLIHQLEKK